MVCAQLNEDGRQGGALGFQVAACNGHRSDFEVNSKGLFGGTPPYQGSNRPLEKIIFEAATVISTPPSLSRGRFLGVE